MWKKWGNWLSVILTIVMLPAMLVQGVGEFLIYGLGYLPRRLFNRKAKLTDDINAWSSKRAILVCCQRSASG